MDKPLVSIIIPVFNRDKLICDTLDSVIKQSYPLWEAIVVDDGSTDGTCSVVQNYSLSDNRIKLIERNREPKGGSTCRNIGIEKANGEFLIFLDSDDLLATICLEKRVEYIKKNPDLDFAIFQMASFDETGLLKNSTVTVKKDNYLYAYLSHDLPWAITCPFWKTTFVRKNLKGYNENYLRLQDPEFNTRALLVERVNYTVHYHADPDCFYRSHTAKDFDMKILISGFDKYIKDFFLKIQSRTDSEICKTQLKYCFIEAIRSYYTYRQIGYKEDEIRMLQKLAKYCYSFKIIKARSVFFLSLLLFAYSIHTDKMKMGKYVNRFLMKLIKIS